MSLPKPISPKTTELKTNITRVRMRGNGHAKNIKELRAKKSAGQNINDSEARLAMILADEDIPATNDIDAQITTEMLNWQATTEAEQLLKPQLAKAEYEAATAILESAEVQKMHGDLMRRIALPLAEAAKAWLELYGLSLELRANDVGFRCGICQTMPTELFGFPNSHSKLGAYLHALVKADYLHANDVPREFRA